MGNILDTKVERFVLITGLFVGRKFSSADVVCVEGANDDIVLGLLVGTRTGVIVGTVDKILDGAPERP